MNPTSIAMLWLIGVTFIIYGVRRWWYRPFGPTSFWRKMYSRTIEVNGRVNKKVLFLRIKKNRNALSKAFDDLICEMANNGFRFLDAEEMSTLSASQKNLLCGFVYISPLQDNNGASCLWTGGGSKFIIEMLDEVPMGDNVIIVVTKQLNRSDSTRVLARA